MKTIYFVSTFSGALLHCSVLAAADNPPGTLEEFCLAGKIDTPANCRCGQKTAERLLTPEEMTIALEFFQGNRHAAVSGHSRALLLSLRHVCMALQRSRSLSRLWYVHALDSVSAIRCSLASISPAHE